MQKKQEGAWAFFIIRSTNQTYYKASAYFEILIRCAMSVSYITVYKFQPIGAILLHADQ